MSFPSNKDFMEALSALLDQWCERRRYQHLAAVLPSFVGFNGLTDGWAEMRSRIKAALVLGAEDLQDEEWQTLRRLSQYADLVLAER